MYEGTAKVARKLRGDALNFVKFNNFVPFYSSSFTGHYFRVRHIIVTRNGQVRSSTLLVFLPQEPCRLYRNVGPYKLCII